MNKEEIDILKDFIYNEYTSYCYDWQGFDHETILPLIEKLIKENENYKEFILNIKEKLNNIQFEVEQTWRKIEKLENKDE